MCVTPRIWIVRGIQTEVACGRCWQCRSNRVWDWVGRSLAEAETAGDVRVVTLTYGNSASVGAVPNEFAAVSVVKRDIRLWFKRMRKGHKVNGKHVAYPLRYLAVAEYGGLKGRVHWHAILFFKDRAPDVPLNTRVYEGDFAWPHGITYWQEFTAASAVYCCKYVLKSEGVDNRLLRSERAKQSEASNDGWMTLSKKPPLGAEYFRRRAEDYVKAGLAPQDLTYSFPEVRERQSKRIRQFHLKRGSASADLFLKHYLDSWAAKRGGHPPQSEVVEEYCDRVARPLGFNELRPVRMKAKPRYLPHGGGELVFVETLNAYACDVVGPEGALARLFWTFTDDGLPGWNSVIMSDLEAAKRRGRAALARDPAAYRAASKGA